MDILLTHVAIVDCLDGFTSAFPLISELNPPFNPALRVYRSSFGKIVFCGSIAWISLKLAVLLFHDSSIDFALSVSVLSGETQFLSPFFCSVISASIDSATVLTSESAFGPGVGLSFSIKINRYVKINTDPPPGVPDGVSSWIGSFSAQKRVTWMPLSLTLMFHWGTSN